MNSPSETEEARSGSGEADSPEPEGYTQPPPGDREAEEDIRREREQFDRDVAEMKERFSALFKSAAALAVAQWQLAVFTASEKSRLAVIRVFLGVAMGSFLVVAWVFFNIGIWMCIQHYTDLDYLAPLTLCALHLFLTVVALFYKSGSKL